MHDLTFRAFRKDNIYFRTIEEREKIINFTETFNMIAMVSIVGGYLRQLKDNLYSNISRSCHSSKKLCRKITFDVLYLNHV